MGVSGIGSPQCTPAQKAAKMAAKTNEQTIARVAERPQAAVIEPPRIPAAQQVPTQQTGSIDILA
jgi:hypothetical protein